MTQLIRLALCVLTYSFVSHCFEGHSHVVKREADLCGPKWIRYDHRHSLYAQHYKTYLTIPECLDFCVSNQQCVSADFDETPSISHGCWIHWSESDLYNYTFYPPYDVSQYVIDRRCIPKRVLAENGEKCQMQWSKEENTNSKNGLHYFQYSTLEDCQRLCEGFKGCLAIDFDNHMDKPTGGCYLHLDVANEIVKYDAENVTHYTINGTTCGTLEAFEQQRIEIPTLVANRPIEAPPQAPAAPSMEGAEADKSRAGAEAEASASQIGINPAEVSPATEAPAAVPAPAFENSMEASRAGVGCSGVWSPPSADHRFPDGVPTQDKTAVECQLHCAQDSFCVGVDVDSRSSAEAFCWLAMKTGKSIPAPGITHYDIQSRNNCGDMLTAAGCSGQWSEPFLNQSIEGSTATNDKSLTDCQQHCLLNRKCVGIDFHSNPDISVACWFNTMPGKLKVTPGATHYDMINRKGCSDTGFQKSMEKPKTPYDICSFYHELQFGHVIGGADSGKMTAEECVASCVKAYPKCVSVDYGIAESKCYHQTTALTVIRHWNNCCMRFELQCLTSTCKDQFARYTRLAPAVPGVKQPNIRTAIACEEACFSMPTCAGFSFSRAPGGRGDDCALCTALVTGTSRSKQVDLYIRMVCRTTLQGRGKSTGGQPFAKSMEGPAGGQRSLNAQQAVITKKTTTTPATTTTSTTTTSTTTTTTTTTTPTTTTTTIPTTSTTTAPTTTSTIATNPPTTTTTTSTSTTTPTTPTTSRFSGVNHAFGAGHSGYLTAPVKEIPLDDVVAGSTQTASLLAYTVPSDGIYFDEVCVGIQTRQTATVSLVEGGKPGQGMVWQSSMHNGLTTYCRSGILKMKKGTLLSMSLDSGAIFGQYKETMLNAFSLTDVLTSDANTRTVFAVGTPPQSGTKAMSSRVTVGESSGVFDHAKSTYTCTTSGLYFFTITAGIGTEPAGVELVGLGYPIQMQRNTHGFEGITTLSRSLLMPCDAGTKVTPQVLSGAIRDQSSSQLITFGAFPYLPKHGVSAAWVLMRNTSSNRATPFKFTQIVFNENGLYDPSSRLVTIQTSGLYYVYISSGMCPGEFLIFRLVRNDNTLFKIDHQVTNYDGDDVAGHGAVVAMGAEDSLKVEMDEETYSCSSPNGHQTLFFGFLLFPF